MSADCGPSNSTRPTQARALIHLDHRGFSLFILLTSSGHEVTPCGERKTVTLCRCANRPVLLMKIPGPDCESTRTVSTGRATRVIVTLPSRLRSRPASSLRC